MVRRSLRSAERSMSPLRGDIDRAAACPGQWQMSACEVLIELPSEIYEQYEHAAVRLGRSVSDVLTDAAVAAAPATSNGEAGDRKSLLQMAYLSDAALWQAARSSMTVEQRERLEELHREQQRRELEPAEREEEQALLGRYRNTVLVRAQAAVLLKHRGYDVSDPNQFAPMI